MQHLARASLGSTLLHVGLTACALTAAATGVGCRQDGPLTDEEMAQLRPFMLPAGPPTDTSNAYADDPRAVTLGQKLYFDGRYAGALAAPYNAGPNVNGALGKAGDTGLVSCASCHDPLGGGADRRSQPSATSLGVGYTGRNASTVINAAYSPLWQFWDGRVDSLWSQALSPPEGTAECASSRLRVVRFLFDHYRQDFEEIFGAGSLPSSIPSLPPDGMPGNPNAAKKCSADDRPLEPFNDVFDCDLDDATRSMVNHAYANFGKAIAAYERKLVSNSYPPSPFDAFMAGDKNAMEPAAIRGARLFVGHAGCTECHRGPMFTDFSFHNIGIPQTGQYVKPIDNGRRDGVGPLAVSMFNRKSADFSDDTTRTEYLDALTTEPPDELLGAFKTPTLRNVSKTAPFMHDGAYQTLWDVVNHYNFGGATGTYVGEKDPAIAPLMLTDAELSDLVEFLEALSDGELAPSADHSLFVSPPLPP